MTLPNEIDMSTTGLIENPDKNPTNQEREKLHISSHQRARGNINFQRDS